VASALDRLKEILASQLGLYKQLMQAAVDKRDQVIANRVDLLEETVHAEIELLSQIEALEAERSIVMLSLAEALGIDPNEATISMLAERLPAEESAELLKLRDTILSTLDELGSQGKVNERLIKDSLRYINFALGLYFPDDEDGAMYDSGPTGGQATKERHRGLFDAKA
jgi:outer membrane protein TolC